MGDNFLSEASKTKENIEYKPAGYSTSQSPSNADISNIYKKDVSNALKPPIVFKSNNDSIPSLKNYEGHNFGTYKPVVNRDYLNSSKSFSIHQKTNTDINSNTAPKPYRNLEMDNGGLANSKNSNTSASKKNLLDLLGSKDSPGKSHQESLHLNPVGVNTNFLNPDGPIRRGSVSSNSYKRNTECYAPVSNLSRLKDLTSTSKGSTFSDMVFNQNDIGLVPESMGIASRSNSNNTSTNRIATPVPPAGTPVNESSTKPALKKTFSGGLGTQKKYTMNSPPNFHKRNISNTHSAAGSQMSLPHAHSHMHSSAHPNASSLAEDSTASFSHLNHSNPSQTPLTFIPNQREDSSKLVQQFYHDDSLYNNVDIFGSNHSDSSLKRIISHTGNNDLMNARSATLNPTFGNSSRSMSNTQCEFDDEEELKMIKQSKHIMDDYRDDLLIPFVSQTLATLNSIYVQKHETHSKHYLLRKEKEDSATRRHHSRSNPVPATNPNGAISYDYTNTTALNARKEAEQSNSKKLNTFSNKNENYGVLVECSVDDELYKFNNVVLKKLSVSLRSERLHLSKFHDLFQVLHIEFEKIVDDMQVLQENLVSGLQELESLNHSNIAYYENTMLRKIVSNNEKLYYFKMKTTKNLEILKSLHAKIQTLEKFNKLFIEIDNFYNDMGVFQRIRFWIKPYNRYFTSLGFFVDLAVFAIILLYYYRARIM
ncbi:hypothetical protein ACO0QE_003223 [Hanseniaspora vineae]